MANLEAYQEYQRIEDLEEDSPPGEEELLLHVTEGTKDSWHHIKNLDNFFTRIYHFHQKNGFACMMVSEFFELIFFLLPYLGQCNVRQLILYGPASSFPDTILDNVCDIIMDTGLGSPNFLDYILSHQFLFVVTFTTFLFNCVEYDVLFANRAVNHTGPGQNPLDRNKVTLPDAILPSQQCTERIQDSSWIIFLLIMAGIFWIYRLIKVFCNILSYWEIRQFYIKALKIRMDELCNFSWQEVQDRLILLQREQQMCIHKKELTELDIYHRILRFKNYMVAMVNKSLLPVTLQLPLLGNLRFLTQGLKYNFELILFWGPGSLFQNKWNLHPKYKRAGNRLELAQQLSRVILLMGVANLLLCPFILVWQVLYAFFSYTEVIRREPGSLGARRWSLYGRLYLRHFNELDHELHGRLGRGYKPTSKYMNSFTSPLLAVLAKNFAFFSGSVLAVLIALTVYDEDVLTVQHILTAITVLGVTITIARSFIPDEHMVWCPEQLLQCVLAHIHYMPDHWRGNANKSETRDEVAQLFQYKAVFILEELLSPIVTPFILIFLLRNKSLEIIDFFRNFTVEVVGVGDICSFAQMDIRRHGNPMWMSEGQTEASVYQQAENGKTELSLMHFTIKNPRWQPPQEGALFISHLKEKVHQDAQTGPSTQLLLSEAPLCTSLLSTESGPDNLLASVLGHPVLTASGLPAGRDRRCFLPQNTAASAAASVLASLSASSQPLPHHHHHRSRSHSLLPFSSHPDSTMYRSDRSAMDSMSNSESHPRSNALVSEFASAEMSLHAIYMHEVHLQSSQQPQRTTSGQWQNPVPMRDLHSDTSSQVRSGHAASGHAANTNMPTTLPLGGWTVEEEEDEGEEEELNSGSAPKQLQDTGSSC